MSDAHLIGSYQNGNYTVHMFSDGTKVRMNGLDHFAPDFPESIDMKICNRCDMGCPMCHEQSTPDGDLADLHHPILDEIHPYTELALGGGNPLEHPDLEAFLWRMKHRKVICNLTVHVNHFFQYYDTLMDYSEEGLVHGVGISVDSALDETQVELIAGFPNAVIHVVAGIITLDTLRSMFDQGLKLLILGYKKFGRGEGLYRKRAAEIDGNIHTLGFSLASLSGHFTSISFDNLAISQLYVQSQVPEMLWNTCYLGGDGEYSMYIDLVRGQYAVSSVSPRYDMGQLSLQEMFDHVRQVKNERE